jgi:hypothetical protein
MSRYSKVTGELFVQVANFGASSLILVESIWRGLIPEMSFWAVVCTHVKLYLGNILAGKYHPNCNCLFFQID